MRNGMRPGTRPQGYLKRAQGEITPLRVQAEIQPRFHAPRQDQRDFPFWKLTLAIASAIVLAAALVWTAMEIRVRYELAEINQQLQAEVRKLEAERQKLIAQQAQASSRIAGPLANPRDQPPTIEASSVPVMRQGSNTMPIGTIACKFGYQSQRQQSGGWTQLVVDGKSLPCRTG